MPFAKDLATYLFAFVLLASSLLQLQCTDSKLAFSFGGDIDLPAEEITGDEERDALPSETDETSVVEDEKPIDDVPPQCTPGQTICANPVTQLVCDENHQWVFVTTCLEGFVCVDGECREESTVETGDEDTVSEVEAPIEHPVEDEVQPEDIVDLPFEDEAPFHCELDEDCPPGFGCDPQGAGDGCIYRNECVADADCGPGFVCVPMGNWMVCEPNIEKCNDHSDCEYGFACLPDEIGTLICTPNNECFVDDQCDEGFVCRFGEQWNICIPEEIPPACLSNEDCEYGYKCETEQSPADCVYANECELDEDCDGLNVCVNGDYWKECRFDTSPEWCSSDADCGLGEYCDGVLGQYGICKSNNQCGSDDDCEPGFACEFNGDFFECVETEPCQSDEECGFGYRCVQASPRNLCEYANECATDADCSAWESCVEQGNWTVCQGGMPDTCMGDDDCPADEYCEPVLGPIGTCRSRNECYVDDDCGEGLVCESNGTYNECVPEEEQGCFLDFQCPDGWRCIDNVCQPPTTGLCSEIEGQWDVWLSTCLTLTQSQSYLFEPEDGCNGSIRSVALDTAIGKFEETGSSQYSLTLLFIQQCEATVTVGTLMSVDCGSCSATLGRLRK